MISTWANPGSAFSRNEAIKRRFILATHLDGRPMALGGLGPLWAVYDADNVAPFKDKPVKERFALYQQMASNKDTAAPAETTTPNA